MLGGEAGEMGRRERVVMRGALAGEIGQEDRRMAAADLIRGDALRAGEEPAYIARIAGEARDPVQRQRRRQHHGHPMPAAWERVAETVKRALRERDGVVGRGEDYAGGAERKEAVAAARRADTDGRAR